MSPTDDPSTSHDSTSVPSYSGDATLGLLAAVAAWTKTAARRRAARRMAHTTSYKSIPYILLGSILKRIATILLSKWAIANLIAVFQRVMHKPHFFKWLGNSTHCNILKSPVADHLISETSTASLVVPSIEIAIIVHRLSLFQKSNTGGSNSNLARPPATKRLLPFSL